ncbi:hypothetical protein A3Q56_00530 [Intoshia linei]|uniref:Pre-mRNA-splicing factor Syf1-like N-terminal HAT-repeats domain-containing protein n=1 Tax=Intoshia linei TaxID=1819745 RepID=A0A177BDQ7_9BILA|nr:hypothetical protein A3Q56_00530 [Intoshia linei]
MLDKTNSLICTNNENQKISQDVNFKSGIHQKCRKYLSLLNQYQLDYKSWYDKRQRSFSFELSSIRSVHPNQNLKFEFIKDLLSVYFLCKNSKNTKMCLLEEYYQQYTRVHNIIKEIFKFIKLQNLFILFNYKPYTILEPAKLKFDEIKYFKSHPQCLSFSNGNFIKFIHEKCHIIDKNLIKFIIIRLYQEDLKNCNDWRTFSLDELNIAKYPNVWYTYSVMNPHVYQKILAYIPILISKTINYLYEIEISLHSRNLIFLKLPIIDDTLFKPKRESDKKLNIKNSNRKYSAMSEPVNISRNFFCRKPGISIHECDGMNKDNLYINWCFIDNSNPPPHSISTVCWDSTNNVILTGSKEGSICIWENYDDNLLCPTTFLLSHTDEISTITLIENENKIFAVTDNSGGFSVWNAGLNKCVNFLTETCVHSEVKFYHIERLKLGVLLTCGSYEYIKIYSALSLNLLSNLVIKPDDISAINQITIFLICWPSSNQNEVIIGCSPGGQLIMWTKILNEESKWPINQNDPCNVNACEIVDLHTKCPLNISHYCKNPRVLMFLFLQKFVIYDIGKFNLLNVEYIKEENTLNFFQRGCFVNEQDIITISTLGQIFIYQISIDLQLKVELSKVKKIDISKFVALQVNLNSQFFISRDLSNCTCLSFTKDLIIMTQITPKNYNVKFCHSVQFEEHWTLLNSTGIFENVDEINNKKVLCYTYLELPQVVSVGFEDGIISFIQMFESIFNNFMESEIFEGNKYNNLIIDLSKMSSRMFATMLFYPYNNDRNRYMENWFISINSDKSVMLWDLNNIDMGPMYIYSSHNDTIQEISVPPNIFDKSLEHCILTKSESIISVDDLLHGKNEFIASRHPVTIKSFYFCCVNHLLVVKLVNSSIFLWNIDSGNLDRVVYGKVTLMIDSNLNSINTCFNLSQSNDPEITISDALKRRNIDSLKLFAEKKLNKFKRNSRDPNDIFESFQNSHASFPVKLRIPLLNINRIKCLSVLSIDVVTMMYILKYHFVELSENADPKSTFKDELINVCFKTILLLISLNSSFISNINNDNENIFSLKIFKKSCRLLLNHNIFFKDMPYYFVNLNKNKTNLKPNIILLIAKLCVSNTFQSNKSLFLVFSKFHIEYLSAKSISFYKQFILKNNNIFKEGNNVPQVLDVIFQCLNILRIDCDDICMAAHLLIKEIFSNSNNTILTEIYRKCTEYIETFVKTTGSFNESKISEMFKHVVLIDYLNNSGNKRLEYINKYRLEIHWIGVHYILTSQLFSKSENLEYKRLIIKMLPKNIPYLTEYTTLHLLFLTILIEMVQGELYECNIISPLKLNLQSPIKRHTLPIQKKYIYCTTVYDTLYKICFKYTNIFIKSLNFIVSVLSERNINNEYENEHVSVKLKILKIKQMNEKRMPKIKLNTIYLIDSICSEMEKTHEKLVEWNTLLVNIVDIILSCCNNNFLLTYGFEMVSKNISKLPKISFSHFSKRVFVVHDYHFITIFDYKLNRKHKIDTFEILSDECIIDYIQCADNGKVLVLLVTNQECIYFARTDDDLLFEDDVQRNRYSVKAWLNYVEHKKDTESHIVNLLFERALKNLPGRFYFYKKMLNNTVATSPMALQE